MAVLDLPTLEGWKAELNLVLAVYLHASPICRQSPIQGVTTWELFDRALNPQPHDHKSDTLLLHLQATWCSYSIDFLLILHTFLCGFFIRQQYGSCLSICHSVRLSYYSF